MATVPTNPYRPPPSLLDQIPESFLMMAAGQMIAPAMQGVETLAKPEPFVKNDATDRS